MTLDVTYKPLQQGQFLSVTISIKSSTNGGSKLIELSIDDIAQVRFRFDQESKPNRSYGNNEFSSLRYSGPIHVYMSYKKSNMVKELSVKLNIQFNKFNYSEQLVCPENWTEWINLGNIPKSKSKKLQSYDLEVSMAVSKAENTFAKLYNDTITTDIKVSVKGSKNFVPMHRSCLLAHSDCFKTFFQTGVDANKEEFEIGEKGVTEQTIHHLKDYIYLGNLPDDNDDLCSLLLLARCYLFENLMSECIIKLVQTVTPDVLYRLMGLACENNMPELGLALLQTPHEVVHEAHVISKTDRKRTHDGAEEPKKKKKSE